MVQEGKPAYQPMAGPNKPPITNDHYLLPLFKEKYAPSKRLTPKTGHPELSHFLEHYKHLCAHYEVTSSEEKCKGLIEYCVPKLAKTIQQLPSYVQGDFSGLTADLYYFMEGEDDSYNLAKVDLFTKQWRKKAVKSLENFKRYHRKFLELVGRAIGSGTIDQKEYNRHFWDGIHRSLRKRIEDRLLVIDPNLDVSIPFEMRDVIKAVATIFNRKRFDQHLINDSGYESDTDSDDEDCRPSRIQSDSEESADEDDEDSDAPRKRNTKKKKNPFSFPFPPKPFPKSEPPPSKKPARDDIANLVEQMKELKLYVMKKEFESQDTRNAPQSQHQNSTPYYNPPPRNHPQYNRPPFNPPPQLNNRSSYGNPSFQPPRTQFANTSYHNPTQRDAPPHMNQNSPVGPPPQEPYCFGCGQNGHHLRQCTELNTLLNQGTVMRNHMGRICWPDGSSVIRDRDEPFTHAINKALKRSNLVRAELTELGTGEVYQYIGVEREESDASSDEQEELGWTPGTITDCYAVGADRNPRVSREARKTVQFNPPGAPQRMQEFPKMRNTVNPRGQNPPIRNSSHLNSNQPRNIHRPTPFDVDKHKFEGKTDSQFLPMDIDQRLPKESGDEVTKVSTNQPRSNIPKSSNPGTTADKVSTEIIQEILKKDVTVQLGPLLEISPNVRRNLLSAVKGQHVALRQTPDQKEPDEGDGKKSFGSNLWQPLSSTTDVTELETRDDLLMVSARVGDIQLTGVVDSGSQANIINERYARACGLPIQVGGLEKIKISGVNGGLAKCVGVIPEAAIYVTDSQLETTGKLLVIEDAAFKLLLGRPWGTRNGMGIREATEGTYLSFDSQGERYEINVSPSKSYRKQIQEIGSVLYAQQVPKLGDNNASMAALSITTLVPDSEDEESIPDDEDSLDLSDNQDLGQNETQKEVKEDERLSEGEEDFGAEEDARNQYWITPPPTPIYTQPPPGLSNGKSIVIETELQESFIKMVQKGLDQAEWDRFCKTEEQKLQKNQDKWKKWKRRREEALDDEIDENSEIPHPDTIEPSQTLAIPEPSQTLATPKPTQPPRKPPKPNKPPRESVISTERRTRRIRRESKKAQESDFWQQLKQRAYERDERFTRKSIKSQNCTASKPALASLGVMYATEGMEENPSEAEENPSEAEENPLEAEEATPQKSQTHAIGSQEDETVSRPTTKEAEEEAQESEIEEEEFINPLIDQLRELCNEEDPANEDRGEDPKAEEEPGYYDWADLNNQFEETIYQCGSSRVTRRNISRLINKNDLTKQKILQIEEMTGVNQVLGANSRFEENKTYPSLSRDEVISILLWCDRQAENHTGGKTFLVYTTGQGTIAVTKIEDNDELEPRLRPACGSSNSIDRSWEASERSRDLGSKITPSFQRFRRQTADHLY
jgi:hypothetical protein